ncbi:uncharacterized protein NPIL_388011 [Nephila pilipes]|uniref:DNA-directed DNA polymerase n=1 Tax=Nephila pilipes TaxID=299642 RepID=A0A8X6UXY2_NEPPI|nr:uncharacterized protein NPIL_121371 [Nephila pilipes]GFU62870.1 uncharacterized protein NPIL_388011 [Nephila pilipes]
MYEKHVPIGFCYFISYQGGHYKDPVVYRGTDAPKCFIEKLEKDAIEIEHIYKNPKPLLPLTESEKQLYDNAKNFYVCDQTFRENNIKVRDHNHVTQKFNGPCCNSCNLAMKTPKFLPVFFHNLSGYDAHIFIKELGYNKKQINLIPNTEEKYISFSKSVSNDFQLRFLDSFKFMPSSLENLIKTLKKDEFKYMKQYFDSEKIDLLLRKGVFPYDYFDSFEKCKDSCLPPISKFYNELNEEAISVEDYNHACSVFNQFNLSNLGEYCDLYVKTDVLLLTDLFENFRKICIQTYKLDPCWYFTTPALSWDAMLLKTKVAIELFTDYDMLLFIENGVRGGISQCCNRYAIANNKYMPNFNPDDEIKYLMYLDANNLYGYAMSKYLPLKDFVWSDNNLTTQDILNLSDESDVGYILEVDLDYPPDLHDKHSDFPLAPENKPPPNLGGKKQLNSEGGVKQLKSRKKTIQLDRYLRSLLRLHFENQNQNYSRRKTTQLDSRRKTLQLDRYLLRLHLENQNQNCSRRKTTQLESMRKNNSTLQQEENNSTLQEEGNNSTRPRPPTQPAPPAQPFAAESVFLPTIVQVFTSVQMHT